MRAKIRPIGHIPASDSSTERRRKRVNHIGLSCWGVYKTLLERRKTKEHHARTKYGEKRQKIGERKEWIGPYSSFFRETIKSGDWAVHPWPSAKQKMGKKIRGR